jgi:hypothetical protein
MPQAHPVHPEDALSIPMAASLPVALPAITNESRPQLPSPPTIALTLTGAEAVSLPSPQMAPLVWPYQQLDHHLH